MKKSSHAGKPVSRRKFTELSMKGMAGILMIPAILPARNRWHGANDRINIAHIGVGDRGGWELKNYFLPLQGSNSIAVCDVHRDRRESWAKQIGQYYRDNSVSATECQSYLDFEEILQRKDIDAVHITTPDHWHVPAAIRAARAGKHIMLAKPLGLSYPDYKKLAKAVADKDVRFHYATQQRTYEHMQAAIAMIKEGKIGDIEKVSVWCPGKNPVSSPECTEVPVPDGFDFNRWTGPAPLNTYCPDRVTNNSSWFQYDYSIGFLAGWGAHPLDVLVWALKEQVKGKYSCEGTGKFWSEGGIYDNIYSWDVKYIYANGLEVQFVSMDTAENVIAHRDEKESNGTTFYGTNGWISLSRNSVQSNIPEIHGKLNALTRDNHSMGQAFLDVIHGKQKEICPLEEAIISDTISHMGDIAIRTRKRVTWDPRKGEVVNDKEGNKLFIREMREPYRV
ncbi:MAG: Gfo/Idh/MocA family oxidoreductase [Cyclobacteriaceae bacterium]|nr:Gfo/Idh/MocA family oxidoreductase [Cyclobacteriaceae bacterium]